MALVTKLSEGFQTAVPSKIRKEFDIAPHDTIEWVINGDKVIVSFNKKTTLDDIVGIIKKPIFNAVELKKQEEQMYKR
jgi:bifunctional DNA-binding transcriptional regulator/antitoxin component of YhaV-PrlF toxin-antitoxin module